MEVKEVNVDEIMLRRDVAEIMTELGVPGYTTADIQKSMFPPIRKTEAELMAENQKLKEEVVKLKCQLANKHENVSWMHYRNRGKSDGVCERNMSLTWQ